jgi:hypothetical protein
MIQLDLSRHLHMYVLRMYYKRTNISNVDSIIVKSPFLLC